MLVPVEQRQATTAGWGRLMSLLELARVQFRAGVETLGAITHMGGSQKQGSLVYERL